jgi:hypothetical protein
VSERTGERLFARYAYAPNELGYCGPAQAAALFELAATGRTDADVPAIARQFSGAWPYAALLAKTAGIPDPLDARVMRAYWTGGPLLDDIDRTAFAAELLEFLGARAGHYWKHLTPEVLPEAAPTHGFHVFGVYPWSRLLGMGSPEPLRVLDSCRIRWGQVIGVDGDRVVVTSRPLAWDGRELTLAPATQQRVRFRVADGSFVPDPHPGEWLALHWDWACDRLVAEQVAYLEQGTQWQLAATNQRLAKDALSH